MSKGSSNDHAMAAAEFNLNEARVDWHDRTLWHVREKRDKVANQVPEWEELRAKAAAIKQDVLGKLHDYLVEFERQALKNGISVHWAEQAVDLNQIVLTIIKEKGAQKIVKSKSMLTEECHLNEHLEKHGIEVIDTDLGERIVQLARQRPSHIVLPAIHLKKEDISELFAHHLGTEKGNTDPVYLTYAARASLRNHFLTSKVALTGVNFAVAETGEFVVCTNEGNADMGVHLADVHIACMGIEKIIPQRKHLGVFLRLLARSATGQPITTYSSHFRRPRKGQEMHVIILDNGRSRRLASEDFRSALSCIRCGACLNTCPVYRRSGGHSYHSTLSGPIGAIIAPGWDQKQYADLPFASTLCGSCSNVCPVKIDIHTQLYKWRQLLVKEGHVSSGKRRVIGLLGRILSNRNLFIKAGKVGRWVMRYLPVVVKNRWNVWYSQRELPWPPKENFSAWYNRNRK